MSGRRIPAPGATKGNFISEWFGHRVWPDVDNSPSARKHQTSRLCPFLSSALGEETACIKIPRTGGEPTGVCTVSSDSNGLRQDWLACPYRVLDKSFTLLDDAVRQLYNVDGSTQILLLPLNVLQRSEQRQRVAEALQSAGVRVFTFAADKLGGEVDIPETDSSPGAKVDVSIVEILGLGPSSADLFEPAQPVFGKHIFFEIQTADFHGSPLHAVRQLQEICPEGTADNYHEALRSRTEICGTGMEGPNKANIFKRTIYQMILKVRMATHDDCAGFAIILPQSVWDSWLRHLGSPELQAGRLIALAAPEEDASALIRSASAWILVFDIDRDADESPRRLKIVRHVATSQRALLHHTFIAAADEGLKAGVIQRFRKTLRERVASHWNNRN